MEPRRHGGRGDRRGESISFSSNGQLRPTDVQGKNIIGLAIDPKLVRLTEEIEGPSLSSSVISVPPWFPTLLSA